MADLSLKYLLFGEDRSASSSIKGVGTQASSTASLVAGGMSKLGNAVGGEVGDMINRVAEGFSQLGEKSKGMGAKLAIGGAAITGLGAAFQTMASGDVEAQNQLKVAIDNTGNSFSDYKEEIEKAIKKQEGFGNSAVQTQDALRILTQATNDPKKAVEQMSVVADLAAAKHISLSDAALKVAKVYGGAGRVLKEFGITMASSKTAAAALTSATTQHHQAVTTLASAQQKLSDLEAIDRPKKTLTIAQQIALRNAHENVNKALTGLKTSTEKMKDAQEAANKATHGADDAVSQLAAKVKGQASASVDTFTGKLDVMRTKATDAAAQFGQKFGPAITMAGVGITALGTVMQILAARQAAAAAATSAETGATVAQAGASKIATAGQWLWNAALSANPIGLVVIAIAALIGIIVLVATKTTWFGTVWRALWNGAIGPVIRFIMDGLGSILGGIANMLDALSHVPGFGWAKDAATKLREASTWAHNFANGINDIPANKTVTIQYNVVTGGDLPSAMGGGGMKRKALGGPVTAGVPYIVGEHRPEVFVPTQDGTIIPRIGTVGDGRSGAGDGHSLLTGGSADVVAAVKALGDRFGAELQRQARTIQTMQRQMA